MERTRNRWPSLMAVCALALAPGASGQNVQLHDPYADRVQRCHQIRLQAPQEALALADTLLATPQLPAGPKLGATLCRAESLLIMGQGGTAREAVDQSLQLLDAPGIPPAQRFSGLMNAAGMLQNLGRTGEALELFERALELAGQSGSPQQQLAALYGVALTRATGMNDLAGAEDYFQRALALVQRHRMPPSPLELMLHYNYGYTLLLAGRHDQAESALARALELAAELPGHEQLRYRTLGHRAETLRARGDPAGAVEWLEQARAWQRDNHDAQGETVTLMRLARVHLDLDAPERALPHARRALELAERGGFAAETRTALDTLVDVHAALGNHEQVIAYTTRALEFERESARSVDLERLAALQARADAAQAAQASSPRANALRDAAIVLLVLLLAAGALVLLRAQRRQRQLATQGAVDPLTGLLNRREGARRIEALPAPGDGQARHALLVVDIDGFKAINDSRGHAAGDIVLAQVAGRLRDACDSGDILARWGGEEFLVVRPDTSREAAFALADHLRRAIEQQAVGAPGAGPVAVTVSIGLAPVPFFPGSEGQWQEAIALADRALYVAKRSGRNAWAGLWGLEAGRHVDLFSVREDPERAMAQGWITIGGNRPMSWSPVRDVHEPRRPAVAHAAPRERAERAERGPWHPAWVAAALR